MILYLRKTNNIFIVDSGEDTIKNGEIVSAEIKRPRNYEFHKKFFALLNYSYECWEPEELEYRGRPVGKDFDRFRKDIIILAGYYDVVTNIKGEVKAEAKSISFGKMEEEEFEKLYSDVINVILKHILTNYSRDDIDVMISEIIGFS
jgi:hypothetical protein